MKKKNLIILLFLSVFRSVFPLSEDVSLQKIDSLNRVLAIQSGSSRVATLIGLSEAYRVLSLDKSLKTGLDALNLATEQQLGTMKAEVLKSLGQSAQLAGDYDLANQYYAQSLQLYNAVNDQYNMARLNNFLGDLHNNISEYDSAIACFDRVEKLAKNISNDTLLAFALLNKGNSFFETGRLNEANDAYYRASIMYKNFGDSNSIALADMNQSQVLWQWNQNDEAIALLKKTISYAKRKQLADILSRAYSNIGLIYYYDLNDYDTALGYFTEALRIRENRAFPVPIAHVLVNMANVYAETGKTNEAIAHLQRSLQIYENANAVQGIVRVYYHLGEVYHQKGDYKQSIQYLEKCQQKAKTHGIETYATIVNELIMNNYISLNDFKGFLVHFNEYKAVNDSVADAYNALQASEAKFRFMVMDLEAERERNEVEKQALKNRLENYNHFFAGLAGLVFFGVMLLVLFFFVKRSRKHEVMNNPDI